MTRADYRAALNLLMADRETFAAWVAQRPGARIINSPRKTWKGRGKRRHEVKR